MPSSGTPVPSDHAIASRPATPGPRRCRRRRARQREHGDRAHDPLDEQVADRAGRLAAQQHRAADDERRPAGRRQVQQREQHRGERPEEPRDQDEPSIGWPSTSGAPRAVGGRPRSASARPARRAARAQACPTRAPRQVDAADDAVQRRAGGPPRRARTGPGSRAAGTGRARRGRWPRWRPRSAGGRSLATARRRAPASARSTMIAPSQCPPRAGTHGTVRCVTEPDASRATRPSGAA